MSAAVPPSPQIEADRRLLQFQTYEDYLDSLVTPQDLCYLQSVEISRTIAELGYRWEEGNLDSSAKWSRSIFHVKVITVCESFLSGIAHIILFLGALVKLWVESNLKNV